MYKFQILPNAVKSKSYVSGCRSETKPIATSGTNSKFQNGKYWVAIIVCNLVIGAWNLSYGYAEEPKEPIVVNGDRVEYSQDKKEVTAEGNVLVVFKDSKLTCHKITVDTQTKEAVAEGNVRLEDKKGVIEAEKATYNFTNKTGTVLQAKMQSVPYFGRGQTIERLSENKMVVKGGYITTCDLDHPHYRICAKKVDVYPQDKIKAKNTIFYVGKIPLLYLPQYTHSQKDPFMHVRINPGSSKDWGAYMLSAWRINLTKNVSGRLYLDYRQRLGVAEGFGLNYVSAGFGKGDYKYYYTQERPRRLPQGSPEEFERYLIRWRHMWDIDPRTKAVLEYYKITDSKRAVLGSNYDFLKDYFYREYEKDTMPKSYLLVNHVFPNASLNLLVQKRTNRWYTHTNKVPDEKLPEIAFDLPSYKLGGSPVYFKNRSQFANLANKNASPSDVDDDVVRLDTYNQLSLPTKIFFLQLTPYAGERATYYTKDLEGNSLDPRTIFYSGLDLSTKFYRFFDVESDFLSLDIHGLRHIISPAIKYAYNHQPSIPKDKLQVFDDIDTISQGKKVILELVNKLQTKRDKKKVDLLTFKTSTEYSFVRTEEIGKGFSDILFDLELLPYAWLRVESDVTYEPKQDNFKTINLDAVCEFGKDRSFGLGHRYERKGGNELTSELNWRLNPKWKVRIYERYQFASARNKGLREQEYSVSRDLHCWTLDFAYNINKEHGHTVWAIFKVKAFPEMEFQFNQSYYKPKANSQ
jgi:lipopolysaccharide assembly outer membrane protein LptD (OstA)